MDEFEKSNEIRVAGKSDFVYTSECLFVFNRYDQVVLVANETYKDKILTIADKLRAIGITIDWEYINKGKIVFKTEQVSIYNSSGRLQNIKLYKLGLTKIPSIYMFTNQPKEDYETQIVIKVLSEEERKDIKNDIIVITDKDFRFYIGLCIEKFGTCEEIFLSANDSYIDRLIYIANAFNCVGIEIRPDFRNKYTGKTEIRKEILKNYKNKSTGVIQDINLNKICLRKLPELIKNPIERKWA